MRKLFVLSFAMLSLVGVAVQPRAQIPFIHNPAPVVSPAEALKPVPRLPDGTVDLTGPWVDGGSNGDIERDGGLKPGELPLLPWARKLRDDRKEQDEPYTACLPMSVPRVNPFPWKFAMSYTAKGLTHIYVLHENGDSGAHRVIYMDGRRHPEEPIPTWWGHSIGRWEGDTLVIDSVGFNDLTWLERGGLFTSTKLHIIERLRREGDVLHYAITVEDPEVLLQPWVMPERQLRLNTNPNARFIAESPPCSVDLEQLAAGTHLRH